MTKKLVKVNIEPSDNIFRELGNNTYDYVDMISELIDNSIAAWSSDEILNVVITIGFSKLDKTQNYLIIRDNADGIPRANLGKALSPGGMSGGQTLNEHGLGMKQAIAGLGTLDYILTKTVADEEAIKVSELRFGEIDGELIKSDFSNGTEIKVINISSIVPLSKQKYSQSVVWLLGARYRRFLRKDSLKMSLVLELKDIDEDKVDKSWDVESVEPTYFHPNLRRNEPVINRELLTGKGWEAKLTFGYAPSERQYEEIGLESPKKYTPYYVSINKQGLDILKNDRVINLHQLSEIGLVSSRHSNYNYIRGELDLIKGFTTAITKNSIIADSNFAELLSTIKKRLEDKGYLRKKSYPDEIPEKLLRDRMVRLFESSKMFKKDTVHSEYPVEGMGGYIDIFADKEAWELKIDDASGQDVYQLFGYMDMGEISIGYLVAKSFKTGAKSAAEFINSKYDKTIELIEREEFPINHPPTEQEIVDYY